MTAEERIKKALFQMDVDWGNGTFNYGMLKAILTGKDEE
jgi:hypothetical protein